MTSIDNTDLVNKLGLPIIPASFVPTLNYAINTATKAITVTDATVFPSEDAFAKVNVHAIDNVTGKRLSGQIAAAAGNVVITLPGSTLSDISITATVVSTKGLVADLGVYHITTAALTGTLGSIAEHAEPTNE